MLFVAHRHAVPVVSAHFRSTAYAFAAWWVHESDPGLEPEVWQPPRETLDWVRDVLRGALAGPHQAQARAAIRTRWWRPLWQDAYDPLDPLDAELMAVACEHLTGATRDQLIRDVQEWAFARMVGQVHPSTVAWNIVFGTRLPDMPDAASFLAGLVGRKARDVRGSAGRGEADVRLGPGDRDRASGLDHGPGVAGFAFDEVLADQRLRTRLAERVLVELPEAPLAGLHGHQRV